MTIKIKQEVLIFGNGQFPVSINPDKSDILGWTERGEEAASLNDAASWRATFPHGKQVAVAGTRTLQAHQWLRIPSAELLIGFGKNREAFPDHVNPVPERHVRL